MLSPPVRGLLWMRAQTTSMCAMMVAVRHLSFNDFSAPQLVFFRGIMGLLVLLPWFLHTVRYEPLILAPREWKLVMWRSLISVVGILCWFLALTGMSVSDVTAVQFTHPLFVVIGAALILRENVGIHRWSAVIIGFLGALVIIRPGYLPFNPLVLGILVSAMSNASVQLITKHVALNISGAVLIFYLNLALVPVALILAIPNWIWPSWGQFGWILAVGAFGTLGHIFLARGMKVADASLLGPVDFMRLPIASAFGWLLFNEYSDAETWIGAGIIFFAVLVITRRDALRKDI